MDLAQLAQLLAGMGCPPEKSADMAPQLDKRAQAADLAMWLRSRERGELVQPNRCLSRQTSNAARCAEFLAVISGESAAWVDHACRGGTAN